MQHIQYTTRKQSRYTKHIRQVVLSMILCPVLMTVGPACTGSWGGVSKKTLHHANNASKWSAEITTAIDGYTTTVAAIHGWNTCTRLRAETNPLLGIQPSPGRVVLYIGEIILLEEMIQGFLPEWASTIIYSLIGGFESYVNFHNLSTTHYACGSYWADYH